MEPRAASSAPPVDEINTARRDYAQYTAKAADLDMQIMANEATHDRLTAEHDAAKNAAATARARVFELENNRPKPAAVEARVMSGFASGGFVKVEPGKSYLVGEGVVASDNVLKDAPETP